jgi:PqqD family protein of HPr-rel-A system
MKLAKYVKFRPERFGGVLFETRSEKVFTLNPTAAAVVREIQAGTEATAIASRLRADFECDDPDRVEREATEFTRQLREHGLVVDD